MTVIYAARRQRRRGDVGGGGRRRGDRRSSATTRPAASPTRLGDLPVAVRGARGRSTARYIGLEPAQLTLVAVRWSPSTRARSSCWCPAFRRRSAGSTTTCPAIVHVTNSGQELGHARSRTCSSATTTPADARPRPGTRARPTSRRRSPTTTSRRGRRTGTSPARRSIPFGHGLSYATFEYANLSARAPRRLPACGSDRHRRRRHRTPARVDGRRGRAALRRLSGIGGAARPLQQLRGFQRVTLAAGATAHVTLSLRAEDLAYWNENAGRFLVEDGKSVELQIGASSRDIRLRIPVAVTR